MKRTLAVSLAFTATIVLHASSPQPSSPSMASPDEQPKPVHFGTWGIDLAGMDRSVQPGDDFDTFVNGAWKIKTPIPADQPSTGVGYDVYNLTQGQIRALIEKAPPTSQLGAMYRSFMDEARVESLDDKPLQQDLKRVAAIGTRDEFTRYMGQTNGTFGSTMVGPGVAPDPSNPTVNTLFLGQAGLGLPDRDYYLNDAFKPQLDAYRAFIERTFTMIGYPEPAKVRRPGARVRDGDREGELGGRRSPRPRQGEQPDDDRGAAGLRARSGLGGLPDRLRHHQARSHDRPGEDAPSRTIAALYDRTPLDTLKAWQAFHVAEQASPYLSKRFVDSRFTFVKTLSGVTEQRPRWKRAPP